MGIFDYYQRKRRELFNRDQVKIENISKNDAKTFLALLYWCEGSKYPSTDHLAFTSSDVEMQKLYITLLRKSFRIESKKIRVWLQIHTDHNVQNIQIFWSKQLNIPISQFYKPHITEKRGRKYRNIYYGTCQIRYYDYRILLRIMGIYQRFYSKALKLLV